jgi:hypothetical protein
MPIPRNTAAAFRAAPDRCYGNDEIQFRHEEDELASINPGTQ